MKFKLHYCVRLLELATKQLEAKYLVGLLCEKEKEKNERKKYKHTHTHRGRSRLIHVRLGLLIRG